MLTFTDYCVDSFAFSIVLNYNSIEQNSRWVNPLQSPPQPPILSLLPQPSITYNWSVSSWILLCHHNIFFNLVMDQYLFLGGPDF